MKIIHKEYVRRSFRIGLIVAARDLLPGERGRRGKGFHNFLWMKDGDYLYEAYSDRDNGASCHHPYYTPLLHIDEHGNEKLKIVGEGFPLFERR